MAHTGTALGMLDSPECVDPSACIVWYRFRLLRRYLAYRPLESARVGRLLGLVGDGAPGHGPVHLLVDSAASLGFQWCLDGFCWNRPGLPLLPMVEGPYPHFKDSILGAWRDFNSADLCRRKGFQGGPLLDFRDPCSSLTLPMSGTETRHCFKGSFLVEFGMVFSLARCKGITFHVVCVVVQTGMVTCFGSVLTPLVAIRDSPEFHDTVKLEKAGWPGGLLWHGWLPALSGCDIGEGCGCCC